MQALALAALASTMFVPIAAAHHLDGDLVLEDEASDFYLHPAQALAEPVLEDSRHDIVEAWLGHENEIAIQAGIRVDDMGPPTVPSQDGSRDRYLRLRVHRDATVYEVTMIPDHRTEDPCHAFLSIQNPNDNLPLRLDSCLRLEQDDGAGFVATIPRDLLATDFLAPPLRGTVLSQPYAVAQPPRTGPMDEAGPGTGAFTFRQGAGDGAIALWTPSAVRASNGEATTMIYQLRMTNAGLHDVTTDLAVETLEPGFMIDVPERVTVPAGGNVTVPVVLVIQFEHRHGEQGWFDVIARPADGGESRLRFGVNWLAVPQPSGHHSTIHLHAKQAFSPGDPPVDLPIYGTNQRLWSNTLADDPQRGAEDFNVHFGITPIQFPLDPRLLLGLQFDVTQSGSFSGTVHAPLTLENAVLEVYVSHCREESDSSVRELSCNRNGPLIAMGRSEPTTIEADTEHEYDVALSLPANATLFPWSEGAQMSVEVHMTWGGPTTQLDEATTPSLRTRDALVRLPFMEYHEPVTSQFESSADLAVAAARTVRYANPGDRVVFEVAVSNQGNDALDADLRLATGHSDAFFLPVKQVTLPGGGKQVVQVAVDIPADAAPDGRFDAIFIASDVRDPADAAAVMLTAMVRPVEDEDIASDVVVPPAGNKSPPVGPLLVVCLASAFARRRH